MNVLLNANGQDASNELNVLIRLWFRMLMIQDSHRTITTTPDIETFY